MSSCFSFLLLLFFLKVRYVERREREEDLASACFSNKYFRTLFRKGVLGTEGLKIVLLFHSVILGVAPFMIAKRGETIPASHSYTRIHQGEQRD